MTLVIPSLVRWSKLLMKHTVTKITRLSACFKIQYRRLFRLTNYCTLEYVYDAELVLSVDGIRKNLRPFSHRHILFLSHFKFL